MSEDAPQRTHSLREVFNGLRRMARAGAPWRMLPRDPPPRQVVYRQTQRWLGAGVFESLVHDFRELLRVATGRGARPSAAVFDSRTLQLSPESGARAEYDGAKRRKASKTQIAVDALGHLPALVVTPASEQDRAQVAEPGRGRARGDGLAGRPRLRRSRLHGRGRCRRCGAYGMRLEVVKLSEARRGLVLPPRRRVVERSFAWAARSRRLVRDWERLPEMVAGLHFLAFAVLMLRRLVEALAQSS